MPYPTTLQEQALIETETIIDFYMPKGNATSGVDIDARTLLRLAAHHSTCDRDRDAIIRFVSEWAMRIAREIEAEREMDAYYESLFQSEEDRTNA